MKWDAEFIVSHRTPRKFRMWKCQLQRPPSWWAKWSSTCPRTTGSTAWPSTSSRRSRPSRTERALAEHFCSTGLQGRVLQRAWTSWEENSMGFWLSNKKNNAPHPRISEGNFKLEYILNSALVQVCLVSSTLVSIWTASLLISDLSALCSCLNWVYLTAVLVS